MLVLLLLATEREREQFNYMHTSIMTTKQFKALYSTCSAAWTEDLHLDMWFPKVLECGFVPASMTSPHPSQALPHFHINTCTICTCTLDWLLSCIEPQKPQLSLSSYTCLQNNISSSFLGKRGQRLR